MFYFTSVRDLERRLAKATEWVDRPKPKVTVQAPEEIIEQNDLAKNERVIFDFVRLALETDSTRILTICVNTGTLTPRQIPGVKTMCHELTRHGNPLETALADSEHNILEMRKIQTASRESDRIFEQLPPDDRSNFLELSRQEGQAAALLWLHENKPELLVLPAAVKE